MLAIFTLNETKYIYRICQIFVARFRIWGGLSNALGRLSLPKPPRGAGAGSETGMSVWLWRGPKKLNANRPALALGGPAHIKSKNSAIAVQCLMK